MQRQWTSLLLLLALCHFSPPASAATNQPAAERPDLAPSEHNTIAVYRRCSPAVVSVANRGLLRDLFTYRVYEVPQGAGSGFVWDKKGHIISNFHVVYQASSLQVALQDGTTFDAKVVGADPDHDIAVLKIEAPEKVLSPIAVGRSADLEVGQTVLAIGNPFGLDTSLSVGVVSALGRNIVSMSGRQISDVIQTDAAINPGNSGGPLLDSSGRLVGMNAAIISTSGSYAGVGFAVPVDTISRIVPQLIQFGRIRRAGMGIQLVPDHIMRHYGVEGVGILQVVPNGGAAKAGLQGVRENRRRQILLGDVILELDGVAVKDNEGFLTLMDRRQAGDKLKIAYRRDNRTLAAEITLQDLD